MAHNRTPFLLNLNPSAMQEPPITNNEFLDSLDALGVWLRVLSAYDSLERFLSPDSTSTQRLASLSNIYLQLGAQFEDQAVSLIAFSVWSKNRELILPDLFSRTFVRHQSKQARESEIEFVHEALNGDTSKSVPVNQRSFFQEAARKDDADIVRFFLGYRWRPMPSVKLVPKQHNNVWQSLPGELRRISQSFYEEKESPRITSAYNKLKHGPQLTIQNPVERAKKFATSPTLTGQLSRFVSFDKPTVRLLFSGANTQPARTIGNEKTIAPFLIANRDAVLKIFFGTMVHHASLFSVLVKMHIALYREERICLDTLDEGVERIVKAHGHYLAEG